MVIKQTELQWGGTLLPLREPVRYLVLHHAGGSGSVEAIHRYHRTANGWLGIAYHLYIRRDGSVWRGRPMGYQGGHCRGYNADSIGLCFEGNFEEETMRPVQRQAGAEAIAWTLAQYPAARIVGHCELSATACPGKYFPLAELKGGETLEIKTILREIEAYLAVQPCPDWAGEELAQAQAMGITDGTAPMGLIPRYQAAIMAKRAAEAAVKTKEER